MSNAEKFLSIFNQIEKYLASLAGVERYESFMSLIRLLDNNKIISRYKNDLREYAELRNAIVHQTTDEPIAEPYDKTVESLQRIYLILKKPPVAYDIASKPVFSCGTEDLIVNVVKEMTQKVYTHIPVLEGGKFIGVFSESTITRWLGKSAERDGFILEATRIGELKEYFDRPEDIFCCYKFVARNTDIFSVKDDFLVLVNKKWRLGAVFVTQNGRKDEKIIGIITSWDLPKIDEYGK